MSEQSNVYENLEDAVFRVLMDRVARVEGEKLLRKNEELRNDPSAAVPEDVQQRCLKTIRKKFAKRDREITRRTTWKLVRLLPLVAIIALLMGLLAYAAFPAIRTVVQNIFLEKNPEYISWKLSGTGSEEAPEIIQSASFSITLPDEYYLTDYSKDGGYEYTVYQSIIEPNHYIHLNLAYDNMEYYTTDVEDVDYYEEIKIHDYDAVLILKEGTILITWCELEHPCFISFYMTGDNAQKAQEIAESIVLH